MVSSSPWILIEKNVLFSTAGADWSLAKIATKNMDWRINDINIKHDLFPVFNKYIKNSINEEIFLNEICDASQAMQAGH